MRALLPALAAACLLGCALPHEERSRGGTAPPAPEAAPSSPAPGDAPAVPQAAADAPGAPAAPALLGLEDCLRLAREGNRALRIADRRVLIARDRVAEDWSNFIPKLTGTGRYSSRSNDTGGRFGDMTFVVGDRDVGTAGASFLVPLYTFGRVRNQGEADTMRIDVAGLEADRARQDLELAVSQAYFRILEAGKIRSVVEESIAILQRQLEIARDFFEQGLVAKNDLLAAEVQLAGRKEERIQAENNVGLATAALNRLIGFHVNRPTRVADVLETEPWSGTLEEALDLAVGLRPDLEALSRRVDIDRAEERVLGSSFLPYLYGFGGYSYSSDSFLLNDQWLSGGIALEIPFDATNFFRLRTRRKQTDETRDLRDERQDDILLQVKGAYLAVREAGERIPVARKAIEEAEENLRMARDQYGQGLRTSTEVLIEEDRLSRSRSNYYRALYDYHDAFARLENAIGGKPPPRAGTPPLIQEHS